MAWYLQSSDIGNVSRVTDQIAKLIEFLGTMLFTKFVGDPNAANDQFGEGTFLDWARHNKRSWKHDQFRVRPLLRAFAGKTLREITPGAIETFKSIRLHSVTRRKTKRSPASVKHEMNVLSRIFFHSR